MRDHDPSLIRFLTARQSELRGLHTAVFGLWVAAMFTLFGTTPRHGPAKLAWLLGVFALPNVVQQLTGEWYARRVGRVGPRQPFMRPRVPWLLLLTGVGIDWTGVTPFAGISAFLLVIAAHALWVVVRDFPFRIYHVGALLLPLLVSRAAGPGSDDLIPQYIAGGAWFVASGLADHWLLLTQLGRARRAATLQAETDDGRWSKRRV